MPNAKIDFNKVGDIVYDFADNLLKDLQKNLDKRQGKFNSPINASGNLRQSLGEKIYFLSLGMGPNNGLKFDQKTLSYEITTTS